MTMIVKHTCDLCGCEVAGISLAYISDGEGGSLGYCDNCKQAVVDEFKVLFKRLAGSKPRKTRGQEVAEKYIRFDPIHGVFIHATRDNASPYRISGNEMTTKMLQEYIAPIIDAECAAAAKQERERCKAIVESHVVKGAPFHHYNGRIDLDVDRD